MGYIENLKEEIANDHDGIGYAQMTPEEIANAINSQVSKTVPILAKADMAVEEIAPTEETIITDAPVFRVINGVPEAPNAVTVADVKQAEEL